MFTKSYIYHLVDIKTGEVRYVGRTVDPDRRMYLHLRVKQSINGELSVKQQWIDWHTDRYGQPPNMVIVDSCRDIRRTPNASKLEQQHIKEALDNGHRLLNHEVLRKLARRKINMKKWVSFL